MSQLWRIIDSCQTPADEGWGDLWSEMMADSATFFDPYLTCRQKADSLKPIFERVSKKVDASLDWPTNLFAISFKTRSGYVPDAQALVLRIEHPDSGWSGFSENYGRLMRRQPKQHIFIPADTARKYHIADRECRMVVLARLYAFDGGSVPKLADARANSLLRELFDCQDRKEPFVVWHLFYLPVRFCAVFGTDTVWSGDPDGLHWARIQRPDTTILFSPDELHSD